MAPWNCARNYNVLALICAAPGTPENPSAGTTTWQKGQPPPPWAYEYMYPADCLRPLWIVPQFTTGFASGVPITTAITGGAPQFWNGPPVKFAVGIDQLINGVPAVGGADTRVIWTNQENAVLTYIKQVTDPGVMDQMFIQAWVAGLAARLVVALSGSKELANIKIKEANGFVALARQADGNEGLTINDVTPDWIRFRGIDYPAESAWSPNPGPFDWGNMLTMY